MFTATVSPDGATDKKVKWSVGGTNAGAVTLYTDADCTPGKEVGTNATDVLTVYAKGISAGTATVTATSNADSTKSASCDVTVIQPYPLWVGVTQVTSANASNIDGNNKASYNDETKTLTLNGYTYNGPGYENAGIYAKQDLTISITGTNNINDSNYGVRVLSGNITITGSGSLTVNGESAGIYSYEGKSITINGGTVNASGNTYAGIYGWGSSGTCSITINSGTVNAQGPYGIDGSLTINGGSVTASGSNKAINNTVKNSIAGIGWTNTGDKATIAVSSEGQTLDYKKVMFPATLAMVTTAPTAKTLTYNGSGKPLVTAGSVEGGTLEYALGTDDKTAPANGWSTDIPTATEPGTYYVWYRVVGDQNHKDVDPACVVVTIEASDPKGMVIATMVSEGKTSLKLTWLTAEGVGGYDIFLKGCKQKGDCPLVGTVEGGDANSYTVTGLKKGVAYKAYVKAWVTRDGVKTYVLDQSPAVFAYTNKGTKKVTNPSKVTVKKAALTVKVGKGKKIKASVKGVKKGKKIIKKVSKLRYISSDPSIATVNKKGKVKGRSAGSCVIYVLANNGKYKAVNVTVK